MGYLMTIDDVEICVEANPNDGNLIKVMFKKDDEFETICYLRKYSNHISLDMNTIQPFPLSVKKFTGMSFDSLEKAASYFYTYKTKYEKLAFSYPLDESIVNYINQRINFLIRLKQETERTFYDIDHEFYYLKEVVQKYNLNIMLPYEYEGDSIVKKIKEFTVSMEKEDCVFEDVPFFSEKCLYELIGKEDARTILALISQLVEKISPSEAKDF